MPYNLNVLNDNSRFTQRQRSGAARQASAVGNSAGLHVRGQEGPVSEADWQANGFAEHRQSGFIYVAGNVGFLNGVNVIVEGYPIFDTFMSWLETNLTEKYHQVAHLHSLGNLAFVVVPTTQVVDNSHAIPELFHGQDRRTASTLVCTDHGFARSVDDPGIDAELERIIPGHGIHHGCGIKAIFAALHFLSWVTLQFIVDSLFGTLENVVCRSRRKVRGVRQTVSVLTPTLQPGPYPEDWDGVLTVGQICGIFGQEPMRDSHNKCVPGRGFPQGVTIVSADGSILGMKKSTLECGKRAITLVLCDGHYYVTTDSMHMSVPRSPEVNDGVLRVSDNWPTKRRREKRNDDRLPELYLTYEAAKAQLFEYVDTGLSGITSIHVMGVQNLLTFLDETRATVTGRHGGLSGSIVTSLCYRLPVNPEIETTKKTFLLTIKCNPNLNDALVDGEEPTESQLIAAKQAEDVLKEHVMPRHHMNDCTPGVQWMLSSIPGNLKARFCEARDGEEVVGIDASKAYSYFLSRITTLPVLRSCDQYLAMPDDFQLSNVVATNVYMVECESDRVLVSAILGGWMRRCFQGSHIQEIEIILQRANFGTFTDHFVFLGYAEPLYVQHNINNRDAVDDVFRNEDMTYAQRKLTLNRVAGKCATLSNKRQVVRMAAPGDAGKQDNKMNLTYCFKKAGIETDPDDHDPGQAHRCKDELGQTSMVHQIALGTGDRHVASATVLSAQRPLRQTFRTTALQILPDMRIVLFDKVVTVYQELHFLPVAINTDSVKYLKADFYENQERLMEIFPQQTSSTPDFSGELQWKLELETNADFSMWKSCKDNPILQEPVFHQESLCHHLGDDEFGQEDQSPAALASHDAAVRRVVDTVRARASEGTQGVLLCSGLWAGTGKTGTSLRNIATYIHELIGSDELDTVVFVTGKHEQGVGKQKEYAEFFERLGINFVYQTIHGATGATFHLDNVTRSDTTELHARTCCFVWDELAQSNCQLVERIHNTIPRLGHAFHVITMCLDQLIGFDDLGRTTPQVLQTLVRSITREQLVLAKSKRFSQDDAALLSQIKDTETPELEKAAFQRIFPVARPDELACATTKFLTVTQGLSHILNQIAIDEHGWAGCGRNYNWQFRARLEFAAGSSMLPEDITDGTDKKAKIYKGTCVSVLPFNEDDDVIILCGYWRVTKDVFQHNFMPLRAGVMDNVQGNDIDSTYVVILETGCLRSGWCYVGASRAKAPPGSSITDLCRWSSPGAVLAPYPRYGRQYYPLVQLRPNDVSEYIARVWARDVASKEFGSNVDADQYITVDWVREQMKVSPFCHRGMCGFKKLTFKGDDRFSIDRRNNARPHYRTNCFLSCVACNKAASDVAEEV